MFSIGERISRNNSKTVYVSNKEYKTLSKEDREMLDNCPKKIEMVRGISYDFEPEVVGCSGEFSMNEDWQSHKLKGLY